MQFEKLVRAQRHRKLLAERWMDHARIQHAFNITHRQSWHSPAGKASVVLCHRSMDLLKVLDRMVPFWALMREALDPSFIES